LGIDPELRLSINARRSSRRLIALDREVSVRELLTHFVELRKPATRSQLRRLAATNPCLPERQRLELLEPMTPRHYSIASSSRLSPRIVALVVSVLDAPARSGLGLFKGVASNHLAADADEVWALLGDPAKNAHVYVCGDGAKMAPAVRRAFLDIYRARTGAEEGRARDWLIGLVESDHYVEDVWAG
jgi:sulfite reductase alpha subunit-like flavoprotein